MGFFINLNGITESDTDIAGSLAASQRILVQTRTVYGQVDAFRRSSAVQSAVARRVNAFGNLRIWAKDDLGKKIINSTVRADLAKLESFNPYQSFQVFNNQVEAYCSIFGTCYVYKSPIAGFPNDFDCYCIPNNLIQPIYSSGSDSFFQRKVTEYHVSVEQGTLVLRPSEVVEIYDNCFGLMGYGVGESRLIALAEPISTLLAIGEMSTQLIADGGARGIIAMGAKDIDMLSAPFMEADKKAMQESLKQYGGLQQQFKYIVTKNAANYIPLTSKIVDMDLSGIALNATIQILDRYGIPSIFASKEPRFKAMPEGRKESYTASIIPEANVRFPQLAKLRGIPERAWKYMPDFAHMDFFQESLNQSAIALNQASSGLKILLDAGIIDKTKAEAYIEPYLE